MKINITILLIAGVLLSACSNKYIYNNVQNNQRRECNKEVDELTRQQCLEETGSDYDSYKRERDKLLDKKRDGKRS